MMQSEGDCSPYGRLYGLVKSAKCKKVQNIEAHKIIKTIIEEANITCVVITWKIERNQ